MAVRESATKEKDDENLGPVLDFMQLLWGLQHGLESRSKRMESTSGVTAPQRMVLRMLGRRPRSTAPAVAKILRVHPSTLTGVLRRLELRGLVKREADENDRRRALFTLTKAGIEADKDKGATVEGSVKKALRKLTDNQVKAAADVL
ncbi:MAG: MarR family transcriptional regulator, partial [Proteobacteria bacterium]